MRKNFQAPRAVVISAVIALFAFLGPIDIAGPLIAFWGLGCAASLLRPSADLNATGRRLSQIAGISIGLVTLGTTVRGIHGVLIGADPPLVSPADIFHVPGYLGLICMAWFLYRSRITRRDPDAWLDGTALALAIMLVLWTTTLGMFLVGGELGAGASLLNGFYIAIVVTALTIVLRIAATPGQRPRAYYLLGVGYFIGFVADMATSVSLALGGSLVASISLAPLAVGLVTAGLNDPTAHALAAPHKESEQRVSAWRVLIVGTAAFGPLFLLFTADAIAVQLVAAGLAICLALVLNVRILRLLQRHQRSADMDRRLALEIASLGLITDPYQIQKAVPAAIDRVVGPGKVTSTVDENHPTVGKDDLALPQVSFSLTDSNQSSPEVKRVAETLIREANLLAGTAAATARREHEMRELELQRGAAQSEQKYQALAQNASDGVFVLDERGHVSFVSPSVEGMVGWKPEHFLGQHLEWCVHENDRDQTVATFINVLKTSKTHHIELRAMTEDAEPLLLSCVFTDMTHVEHVEGVVVNITDITAQRLLESNLRSAELFDPLTLLFNRNTFIDAVTSAIRENTFTQTEIAVAVINIDDFRVLNEGLGTEVGDHVLVETAARIRRHLRVGDIVARLNGDEFGVLMTVEHDPDQVTEPIDRILAGIAEPILINGHEITIHATAGLALDLDGSSTGIELMRNADTAVDTAKERQRGNVMVFDEKMGTEVSRRVEIRNRLRRAIENEELRLVYQPLIDIRTGRIASLEALARWTDDELGVVEPSVFIPVAERTGLIVEFGAWAIRSVCKQIAKWETAGLTDFSVSVNLSGEQLRCSDITKMIADAIEHAGIAPKRLTIEITESILIDDDEVISERICEIRNLGVNLAIDDFGTGYSSLNYLRRYEFDILKIDRDFVTPLADPTNQRERHIAEAIIGLSHSLGAVTAAEGIENVSELNALAALGCDQAQGFFFYRPTEVDEVAEVLWRSASVRVDHAA